MLELRSAAAVGCHSRPTVGPGDMTPGALGDHRLDRESHPGFHDRGGSGLVEVRDLRPRVEDLADPVSAERADHTQGVSGRVPLDGAPDIAHGPAAAYSADAEL